MPDPAATPTRPEVIVALDVQTLEAADALIALLHTAVRWFKVGLELFTAAGPAAVDAVHRAGGRVFLDLKLHDIPTTAAGAVRSASRLGVSMLTLHLAGGDRMVEAAVAAARAGAAPPILLGVHHLTSDPAGPAGVWEDDVRTAARSAAARELDGMIAAAGDVALVRSSVSSPFLIVSPGIRPAGSPGDDQSRAASPADAARAGADFIVVGRPIIRSPDPLRAAQRILREMDEALATAPA